MAQKFSSLLPASLIFFSFLVSFAMAFEPLPPFYQPSFLGPSPLWYEPLMVEHAGNLIRSYNLVTGKSLVSLKTLERDPIAAAKELFFLPRVVVSHGTQIAPDGPVLNYGNNVALKRWSASWEALTSMPSKYTAEPVEQSERQEFLNNVLQKGFVDNYSGAHTPS